jgi:hypothetical protein
MNREIIYYHEAVRLWVDSLQVGILAYYARITGEMRQYGPTVVQWFINTVTYFLLREDHFPLTLTLSPIGGEGKRWDRFDALPS